jgi:hypothetical protein
MGRQGARRGRRETTRRIIGIVVGGLLAAAGGSAFAAAFTATPAVAATEKTERAQVIDLLASIPLSSRVSCRTLPVLPTDVAIGPQAAHVIASVVCQSGSGEEHVFYTRFDDSASMEAAYAAYVPDSGSGDSCPGSGTWDQDDEDAGKWSCYVTDNHNGVAESATIVWTHDATNTLASAYRDDSDLAALDEWWSSDDAGPLPEPDRDGLPKVLTTTQWLANGKALKGAAPKTFRSTCTPMSLTEDSMGRTFFAWRPWMLGGLHCEPDGVNAVDYFKFAPAASGSGDGALGALSDTFAGRVDESDARVHDGTFSCEGEGTWSRAKRAVGDYACFFDSSDAGDFTGLVWTDDAQDILAYSTVSTTGAEPLLEFWVGDSGPLPVK